MDDIISSNDFADFVNRNFDLTADYANINEIAVFSFGAIGDAIEAFERIHGARNLSEKNCFDDADFVNFVLNEFNDVQVYASVEELASWAFGSIDEAIRAFSKGEGDAS